MEYAFSRLQSIIVFDCCLIYRNRELALDRSLRETSYDELEESKSHLLID